MANNGLGEFDERKRSQRKSEAKGGDIFIVLFFIAALEPLIFKKDLT